MAEYTQQQTDKALENLPEELSEALFSTETAQHIWDIREKYKLEDERAADIPRYVGYVLMGLLSPQEFQQTLQKEIGLSKKTAEQVGREISRFVFYPVKPALEQLHSIQTETTAKKTTPTQGERQEQPSEESSGPDLYREEIA